MSPHFQVKILSTLSSENSDTKKLRQNGEGTFLERTLRSALTTGEHVASPIVDNVDMVAEKIVLETDLSSSSGRDLYLQAAHRWTGDQKRDLPECTLAVKRVSQIGPGEVVVRWNTTWLSPGIQKLAGIARSWPGGLHIEYYDLLDKVDKVSQTSFLGVIKLFFRAATERKMRIPVARIWGTSKFEFITQNCSPKAQNTIRELEPIESVEDAELTNLEPKFFLIRQTDSLDLYPLFQKEGVKNRQVTKDFVLFLDTRRPPEIKTGEWDNRIWDNLNLREVPGMGQFDVDGVDTSSRSFEDAAAVLAFLVLCSIIIGCSIGWLYFQQLQQAASINQLFDLDKFS
eukprot:CAMPEP_0196589432 /NCGR_PEP_ID=MMETSP1081-20130531/63521_1 /TAXON_ID=36882 /ORGANISM="Pyramimonas amylifera, Strain CCMP720" /LENGTH=342 /DNA_ID=CAMNT_0041912229 /DNA_START=161 /DNA_END=1189 /DNA_ORIENTATION=-